MSRLAMTGTETDTKSIPELELSGKPIPELESIIYKKNGTGIDKFGIEVCYKKLKPQINLPFNFLIQKYFFHDNPTSNINYSE